MSNILYNINNDYFNNDNNNDNDNNNNYTMIFFKDINANDNSKIGYSTIIINDNMTTYTNTETNTETNIDSNTDNIVESIIESIIEVNIESNIEVNTESNIEVNIDVNTDSNTQTNDDVKIYKMIDAFTQTYIDIEDTKIKNINASTQTNECFDINKLKIDILALQVKNSYLEKNFVKVSNLLNSFTKIDTLNPKIDNIKNELIKLVNREVRLHRPFPFIKF